MLYPENVYNRGMTDRALLSTLPTLPTLSLGIYGILVEELASAAGVQRQAF